MSIANGPSAAPRKRPSSWRNWPASRGLKTAVGLQARVDPALMYLQELVASGYVGEILAVKVGLMREGVLTRPSHRTWQRDASLGANTLTIANGHTIDAMRFVTGDFRSLSAVVATQAKQWLDTGTNTWLDVTAPDNILISGRLQNGAVVSSHVAAIPYAGSGYRMEIYGSDGTLVASGEDLPQLSKVFLHGAQRGNELATAAGTGAIHRRRARNPRRRAAECRPDVCAVRARHPRRRIPPAGFRDGGRPAPSRRRDQAILRHRAHSHLAQKECSIDSVCFQNSF